MASGSVINRLDLQNRNWPVEVFENWRRSGLLVLDMPYQRGEVWGTKRRRNFILSLLRGIPTPSIVVNDRLRADFTDEGCNGYAIVDGKQRVTTILAFLDDRLSVPRDWFDDGASSESLVVFSQLAIAVQRRFKGRPLATAETLVKTLAEEQTLFDMINYGGLAQGEIDDDCDLQGLPERLDQSWTTRDVLEKLADAANILLERCSYDGHGWEEIAECREIALKILSSAKPLKTDE
jgi:hypothetical protein